MTNSPDYVDASKKAYYLWHNGGIKTNLDTWLSEAETDADKEKVINNVTWLIGRVADNTSYNPHLLGKYKTDGSESDFISSLRNKTIEGNSYISTYSCVNYVSYYLNGSLSPLNSTCSSKWLFTSLGSDLYTIQLNDSKGSYVIPNGSGIKLSSEPQSWKLYTTDVVTYDGLGTYLIQNVGTTSYLAFNTDTGDINYWKKAETDTWKKTWVIADKPYCTEAPKPIITSRMLINSYHIVNGLNQNVLRAKPNVGINFVDGNAYSDNIYYDLCYTEDNDMYALYNSDAQAYLTVQNKQIATTKNRSQSQWKIWGKTASGLPADFDDSAYFYIQDSDTRLYINFNLTTGEVFMDSVTYNGENKGSKVFVSPNKYYVPTAAPTTAAPTTAAPTTAAPTTAAPTTAAPTTAAPTTAAPTALYYGIYRYSNIGLTQEKALMMPVVRSTSAKAAQTAFEANMGNYQKYYYKPASSSDYNESKMANYTYLKQYGNYNYTPSWSGGTFDGIIVSWSQVPS